MNEKKVTAGEVLDRLCQLLGCKNDAELAKKLGVGRTTISTWRARNSIPYDKCLDVAASEGVTLDYIVTGRKTVLAAKGISESAREYRVIDEESVRDATKRVFKIASEREIQPEDPLKIGPIRDLVCMLRLNDDQIRLLFDLIEQVPDIYGYPAKNK